MQCPACGSTSVQFIKVFAGHNAPGWAPANGEKDLFGNPKQLKPLHAHACQGCGQVMWNITLPKPTDPDQVAQALIELAETEEVAEDPDFILADETE